MLVLSRRPEEKIVLPDVQTTIKVVEVRVGAVRLGIEAPPEVAVHREEVWRRKVGWEPAPAGPAPDGTRDRPGLYPRVADGLGGALSRVAALCRELAADRTPGVRAVLDRTERELLALLCLPGTEETRMIS